MAERRQRVGSRSLAGIRAGQLRRTRGTARSRRVAACRPPALPVRALPGLVRSAGGDSGPSIHLVRRHPVGLYRPRPVGRRRGQHPADAPAGLAAFNVGFEHRTSYEWLSRDAAEVDAYVADPWCGWGVPEDVIPSLFAPAPRLADPALLARIRSDLPILIASGDADPLAAGGVLIRQLGQRYRDAGVADVAVKLYPAARHEILNETNLDEVMGDVVEWLLARAE